MRYKVTTLPHLTISTQSLPAEFSATSSIHWDLQLKKSSAREGSRPPADRFIERPQFSRHNEVLRRVSGDPGADLLIPHQQDHGRQQHGSAKSG